MRKIISAVLILMIVSSNTATIKANAETNIKESELYAKSAVLLDADSGRTLYGKNENEQLPMASTTKIMTLIVTLENAKIDEIVTVSKYASTMPDVQLNMKEGEQYFLNDLLYSLMLESHNDSAVAIAEHVGGSVEGFATLMNEKAKSLGCKDTYFITPNGLDSEKKVVDEEGKEVARRHSTTARDLATIMKYCIMDSPMKDTFLEITRKDAHSFTNIIPQQDGTYLEGNRSFSCQNHNAFLGMMQGALSGKTGFTALAGYCYVGALEQGGKTFIVALLACGWPNNKTYKWSDTRKLMNYGLENYNISSIDEVNIEENVPKYILVEHGQTDCIGSEAETDIRIESDQDGKVLLKNDEQIQVSYEIPSKLYAPVKRDTCIGKIYYKVDGVLIGSKELVVNHSIQKITYKWCLKKVLEQL